MGKRCADENCPYFANDGTCLLPEHHLKDKCPALELAGPKEREETFYRDFIRERLRAQGVLE